jgi:dolichol-phosphate mannosyltransferase
MSTPRLSLVIPTLNEVSAIADLLKRLEDVLREIPHEIIVVDDHSADGTGAVVAEFARRHPSVRLMARPQERGLGSAVLAGWATASGEYLGVMDADGSHDPSILPSLVGALEKGAEIAIGTRWMPGGGAVHWPWYRRLASHSAAALARAWLSVHTADPLSGYFLLTRSLYKAQVNYLTGRGFKILLEILVRARPAKIAEIPFLFQNRSLGKSKLSGGVITDYVRMLLELR